MSEIGTGNEGDMTKIGTGNTPPDEPSVDTYKRQLDASSTKFLKTLEQYDQSQTLGEQAHLKTVLDQQMALIKSTIRELNKHGIHKGAMKVGKDYMDYMEERTPSNYTCLHNDVETLQDLNKSI